jgi:hypothetical protein
MVVVDDCPDAPISWRLANHSRPAAELQRDFGDFDRKIDGDTHRSVMAQTERHHHAHTVGADTRRLPLYLSGPSCGTLPPDFHREFQRNPNAGAKILHTDHNPSLTWRICRRQGNSILPLLQVSFAMQRHPVPRPGKSGSGVVGMAGRLIRPAPQLPTRDSHSVDCRPAQTAPRDVAVSDGAHPLRRSGLATSNHLPWASGQGHPLPRILREVHPCGKVTEVRLLAYWALPSRCLRC